MLLEFIKKTRGIITSSGTHRIPCLYLTTVGNCSFSCYNSGCNSKAELRRSLPKYVECDLSRSSLDLIEDTLHGYLKCNDIEISWDFSFSWWDSPSTFNISKVRILPFPEYFFDQVSNLLPASSKSWNHQHILSVELPSDFLSLKISA